MNEWGQAGFDRLYGGAADPYGLRVRWYEARKRSIVRAMLPHPRYRRAFEPACGIGELTLELAPRCERLLASDFSAPAVAAARERVRGFSQAQIEFQVLPEEWPDGEGEFDLIVLSEFCYFLGEAAVQQIARHCRRSLSPTGTLLACDWLPAFDGRRLGTERIHQMLDALGLPCLARYRDEDFMATVWSRDPESVARRDGLGEAAD